jgi:cell division protein FtsA
MTNIAEDLFSLPVRVGLPGGVGGLAEIVKFPEFASVTGLLELASLRTVRGRSVGVPGRVGGVIKKVTSWFSEQF